MISEQTRNKWDSRIAALKELDGLSDWEIGFLDSIDIVRAAGKDLTFKQSSKLREIAVKRGIG